MSRFHISPDGQARKCTAKKVCKYGEDVPHFSTAEDARTAYEASQAGSFSQSTLTKKAYEKEAVFVFEGAELDSTIWLYHDGSEGLWRNSASVSLVADGREYRPKLVYGKWYAEINREYANEGGWGSTKGTKSFTDFADLASHVEMMAGTRAKQATKNPDMTPDEIRTHLREEKGRYDALDAEVAALS